MVTTPQQEEHFGPAALLRILRRRLGAALACAILVPAAALGYSLSQEKEYSASASLLFRDPQFDQKLFGSTVFQPASDPARAAATNVRLVSLDVVAARTAKALGPPVTSGEVQGKVVVEAQGQSDVVSIIATDPRPEFAARLANAFAEQYIAFRREADRSKIASAQKLVQSQIDRLPEAQSGGVQGRELRDRAQQLEILGSLQTGNAELVQTASPPADPSSPKPVRNTGFGIIFGLILGIGLAVLLERLDRRLKDPKEISDAFDRPILGAIPESRAIATAGHDAQRLAPGEAEAFRMLRANLRYFNVDSEIRSVLITSSSPGDGKSTVAVHLAAAAAAAGSKVVLIEADLRHPTLARRLGLPPERGLSQLLAGEIDTVREAAHSVPVTGKTRGSPGFRTMDVLVSGPIPPNPTDLIESDRMRDLLATASDNYELVVVDTPPTSVVSDAIPLVKQVSGVIVVCRLGKTSRESAQHLRGQLANLEANTLGVVVNSVGRQGGYGYGYGYGYGPAETKRKKGAPAPLPPPEPLAHWNGQDEHALDGDRGADPDGGADVPARPGADRPEEDTSTTVAVSTGNAHTTRSGETRGQGPRPKPAKNAPRGRRGFRALRGKR